jgi:hypothetical protein
MKKFLSGLFIISAIITGISNAKSAFADDSINAKLSQTKNDVTKLLKIQDDMTIPAGPKQQMEIDLRREIISNVLDVAQSQLSDIQNQLSSSTLPQSDEWNNVRSYLLNTLTQDELYYRDTQSSLQNNQNMTPTDLKNLARSLEAMKSNNIDKDIARVDNVLAAVNINSVLSVADDRLSKVGIDINRIYSNKLTQNQTLETLYNQASDNLKNAHRLNDDANQAILNLYTSTTTTSTDEFVAALKEKILIQKISSIENQYPLTDTSTIRVTQDDIDSYLANTVSEAYSNIKAAYDVFVNMSVNVKKYLQ